MTEPHAGRPHMPGYGVAEGVEGLLDWSWAEERLKDSRNYFIASTRPDGRPHLMPVWGVWHDGRLFFSTARTSTKARNLLANPRVSACVENGSEAVILEGTAAVEEDADVLQPVWDAYKAKYDWDISGESIFVVAPAKVFSFIEATGKFESTATRWRFPSV